MGEQPIFTTKAHVFQIDPNTKKKWLPASNQAVNVSYYFDSSRNTHRIISVEGSKAIINSTITPNMTFTKTSQKFGQWSDTRANTVYGLGFSTELELAKFIEKFKEVKELTRQAATDPAPASQPPSQPPPIPAQKPSMPPHTTTNGSDNHIDLSTVPSPVNSPRPGAPSPATVTPLENEAIDNNSSPSLPSNQIVEQLKYENDRLKIALAQSSANAKKWEIELQTLKNNNARLTTALQESTSNVEEWKKQLAAYKEESARMKKKVLEMEKGGAGSELLQRQLTESREKVQDLERAHSTRQEEMMQLTRRIDEMKSLETDNQKLKDKIQMFEKDSEGHRRQVSDLQQQLDAARALQIRDRQQLRGVQKEMSNKLTELYELNDRFAEMMQS